MTETFDSIDRHLAVAGSIDRAAIPGGFYVSWCANLGLLTLPAHSDELISRVRFRDASPIELYVAGCGGSLEAGHLTYRGVRFTREHFERYLAVCRETFGADIYAAEPSWENYDRLAKVLTVWLLGAPRRSSAQARPAGRFSAWLRKLLT
ncbi:MAG: hypothetical protein AAF515_19140 [Pseudomonadota bacterium]